MKYNKSHNKYSKLTPRERQILLFLLFNPNYRACAKQFYIAETTLKTHINNIFLKLEVNTLAELLSKVFSSKYGCYIIRKYRKAKNESNKYN